MPNYCNNLQMLDAYVSVLLAYIDLKKVKRSSFLFSHRGIRVRLAILSYIAILEEWDE